ncbi:MAG: hypothetical protein IPQ07_25895 [Myxococcales bacterium]|nr:hypothetical protein [Myxococcales bacterium]
MVAVASLGLLGCGSEKDTPANKDPVATTAAPRDAGAVAIDAAAPARKVFLHGAGRCGECHEKMFDEWETSAHARAATSPLFKAASASAHETTCARCHTPLAADAPKDMITTEGVTCDVCHTLREPKPAKTGAGFRLAIDDMVKFGPRCNLDDHYFHRMGCSPEHQQAELCGSCHWWEPRGVPVFTEYADWKAGPAAAANQPCQDCHMPKEKAPLAVGAPVRTGVPHHGMLGLAADLRARALGLAVSVKDEAGTLAVTVALTNAGAGHFVPSGLPERRVVVVARVVDPAGAELAVERRSLGRVLVDAKGAEVPFWRAIKVGSDSRIAPGATWSETFSFTPPGAGVVEIEVLYRSASETLTRELALPEVESERMTGAKVPFGGPGTGGRAKLPKTVTVKPPVAKKRPAKQGPAKQGK